MTTTRYVALLRGINVGGHTVKMPTLRRIFESAGLSNVETVIASGNVVFDAAMGAVADLEGALENHLARDLGFDVATFLRTISELSAVAKEQPFDLAREKSDAVVYTVFLKDALDSATRTAVRALSTNNDLAQAGKREVYWLRRERGKASDVFGIQLNKLLGSVTTSRNINTVYRILAKCQ